ncbi:hypothetical protein [Streptomyces sp. 147326]|uniref:hypothetical protein n=1 Tax=Streptomyces sp. 147326 TaxID=3074379 RepID=UPI003857C80C
MSSQPNGIASFDDCNASGFAIERNGCDPHNVGAFLVACAANAPDSRIALLVAEKNSEAVNGAKAVAVLAVESVPASSHVLDVSRKLRKHWIAVEPGGPDLVDPGTHRLHHSATPTGGSSAIIRHSLIRRAHSLHTTRIPYSGNVLFNLMNPASCTRLVSRSSMPPSIGYRFASFLQRFDGQAHNPSADCALTFASALR